MWVIGQRDWPAKTAQAIATFLSSPPQLQAKTLHLGYKTYRKRLPIDQDSSSLLARVHSAKRCHAKGEKHQLSDTVLDLYQNTALQARSR